jgi:hypothetical protein
VVRLRQPDEVVETYGSQNQNCFSSLIFFGVFFTFFNWIRMCAQD